MPKRLGLAASQFNRSWHSEQRDADHQRPQAELKPAACAFRRLGLHGRIIPDRAGGAIDSRPRCTPAADIGPNVASGISAVAIVGRWKTLSIVGKALAAPLAHNWRFERSR